MEDDDLTEEDILKASEAYLVFVDRFSEYVRTMDPALWAKAREYAADFTQIPGVKIELVDEEELDDTDNGHKSGAD